MLAGVPALLSRLGRVPFDHAFNALMGGCAPYNLIVRSLSITKVCLEKKLASLGIEHGAFNQYGKDTPSQQSGVFAIYVYTKYGMYNQLCLGCGFAGM